MAKTLTEQWREGTLPDDTYYWKVCKENWIANKNEMFDYTKVCDVVKIECLSPVPSYKEYKKLKKQLEIARIVLGQIAMFSSDKADSVQCAKAIKDMSEVEE